MPTAWPAMLIEAGPSFIGCSGRWSRRRRSRCGEGCSWRERLGSCRALNCRLLTSVSTLVTDRLKRLLERSEKSFGVSPSLYRRMGATYTHLYTTKGIHHYSGKDDTKGVVQSMDLFDLFSGQETWHTRRLLNLAERLNDEQLDRPLKNQVKIFPWNGPDQTLRQVLDRMVQTKEAWAAALSGGSMPLMENAPPEQRTPSALLARMEKADAAFHGVLRDVHNRSAWEDTFVDALCEPPETFTFGGVFAHVIAFNFYRRMLAIDALRYLGVNVEGFGCPAEYMTSLAPDTILSQTGNLFATVGYFLIVGNCTSTYRIGGGRGSSRWTCWPIADSEPRCWSVCCRSSLWSSRERCTRPTRCGR